MKLRKYKNPSKKFREVQKNDSDQELYELVNRYVKGFDVAGAEHARSASSMRDDFLEVRKDCISITIHAGETQPAESIWEAVYELNADRIGHGLTLIENHALERKFLDRGIGIELCPSSNYQIIGYDDPWIEVYPGKTYPLRHYLDVGLKVTLNTDNRGISHTNLSHEFIKASHMTDHGLSLFDALQLSKNSLDISFFDHDTKERLQANAQVKLDSLLQELFNKE